MIGNLIVGIIVTLAALHVAARYLPAGWRRRIVFLLQRRGAAQSKLAQLLNTESSCGSGCDTCKACEEPAPAGQRVIKLHRRS